MKPWIILSVMAMTACGGPNSVDRPTVDQGATMNNDVPADFHTGAIYGISDEDCRSYGGNLSRDGNGLSVCFIGAGEQSLWRCGDDFVALLKQENSDRLILWQSAERFGTVESTQQADGIRHAGEHSTLIERGDSAELLQIDGSRLACRRVER